MFLPDYICCSDGVCPIVYDTMYELNFGCTNSICVVVLLSFIHLLLSNVGTHRNIKVMSAWFGFGNPQIEIWSTNVQMFLYVEIQVNIKSSTDPIKQYS